jgi:hypothetical protein
MVDVNQVVTVHLRLAPSKMHLKFPLGKILLLAIQTNSNGSKPNTPLVPAQWLSTDLDFPVDNVDSFERYALKTSHYHIAPSQSGVYLGFGYSINV